ncbi:lipopolysaccharide biosynthesis protein [Rhodoferax sp. WC2427]|uniref:lipopolysaccharide biosynthesis protein n=1 Tax=Rhodoferax sp. WC2427 TaxID=3234144 RepID=UPI0034651BD5
MGLKNNILANYLGTGTIALAPILALPWYLQALGPKQFGLIGFITMLQALLGIMDAGTSQALVREFAIRFNATDGGKRDTASLLYGVERLYWVFGLTIGTAILLLSNVIATHWLVLDDLPLSLGTYAICGAGILFAVQFPGSVYRSLLVGTQAQIPLNAIMLIGALARHVGGVMVVLCWPTLYAYLVWQAGVGLLETLARGHRAWRTTGVKRSGLRWEPQSLLPVWKTIANLTGTAWLAALTVQMDKIILSKMVGLQQFGYYTIAASIALGALQLVYPLIQAVMPMAIQLRFDPRGLRKLSIKLLWLFGGLVAIGGLLFAAMGEWMLHFWVRNATAATAIYPVLSVLLIGTALNAFYNVGYIHWLVVGKVDRMLKVNLAALVLSIAIIPPLVDRLGIIGAAFGWLSINLIGFTFSLEWLRNVRSENGA